MTSTVDKAIPEGATAVLWTRTLIAALLAVLPGVIVGDANGVPAGGPVIAKLEPAQPSASADEPGRSEDHTYQSGILSGTYRVFTPGSYEQRAAKAKRGVPLLVVVHGCATTAAEQEAANRQNRIAERNGMIILYPNTGALGPARCWDWYTAGRDAGDAALIVGMIDEVRETRSIDHRRIYVIGMSSGGMLTSVLVASYPDFFAAAGLMAGIAYKDVGCPFTGVTIGPELLSDQALSAMGERARVVPMVILRGTEDTAIPQACGDTAAGQWVLTNQTLGGPLRVSQRRVEPVGRYPSTVSTYRDTSGCLTVQRWEIEGMGHYWSGGDG